MAKGKVKGTIAELSMTARINGTLVNITDWSVISRVLETAGCARIVGEQKPASGKGRTSKVWEVDADIKLSVTK